MTSPAPGAIDIFPAPITTSLSLPKLLLFLVSATLFSPVGFLFGWLVCPDRLICQFPKMPGCLWLLLLGLLGSPIQTWLPPPFLGLTELLNLQLPPCPLSASWPEIILKCKSDPHQSSCLKLFSSLFVSNLGDFFSFFGSTLFSFSHDVSLGHDILT